MSVDPPRSVYAPGSAVYVDLNSKDAGKVSRSLAQMQTRLGERNVVFFKEVENFFAVRDEVLPNLFVKQLGLRRDP